MYKKVENNIAIAICPPSLLLDILAKTSVNFQDFFKLQSSISFFFFEIISSKLDGFDKYSSKIHSYFLNFFSSFSLSLK
jgi:hypothetical protein